MSTQLAPLPTSLPTEAARAASRTQESTAGRGRGNRPGAPAEKHHPQRRPNGHLCTCGKLREQCVRDRVRALWS
jgi:hypothetical protein